MINKIKIAIKQPWRLLICSQIGSLRNILPDKVFLKLMYRACLGRKLDLKNPQSYTEKLQWLKIYDRKPMYTKMVDKYEAKKYVASIIGEEYIIETLGVWDNFDEIDFDKLPNQFVLKCTHDSAGLVICKNKSKFDIKFAKKKIEKCLKRNFYFSGREWPYKNVTPRIIAEKYMIDSTYNELRDYKFFTFGGKPKILYITQGRDSLEETTSDFFDMEYKHLPFIIDHPNSKLYPEKPENFELMKELASKLSQNTPQLRVDFYEVDGQVYFGELTFFHCSGFDKFHPEEWDFKLGQWVQLPNNDIIGD